MVGSKLWMGIPSSLTRIPMPTIRYQGYLILFFSLSKPVFLSLLAFTWLFPKFQLKKILRVWLSQVPRPLMMVPAYSLVERHGAVKKMSV